MNDCKTEIILCSWKDCLWSFFLPKHVNCLLSGSAAARMQIWMFRYDFFKVLIDTANRCHSEIRSCGYLNRDRDLLTINRAALSERGDSWLQLQSTPCEALTSVWISFAWLYSQACGHPCCLCTFSYPNSSFQSTLHLICFDTALCKQPHLSVMTLCDLPSLWRASMFVFWTIAKSAVFPIIVVSKKKRYPEFILQGWSLIETQM